MGGRKHLIFVAQLPLAPKEHSGSRLVSNSYARPTFLGLLVTNLVA